MKTSRGVLLAVAAVFSLLMVGVRPAAAVSYTLGGGWVTFHNTGVGTFDTEGTFSTGLLLGFNRLRVVDLDCAGDQFLLLQSGLPFFATTPVATDTTCTSPVTLPDTAFADSRFSQADIVMPPSVLTLTFQQIQCSNGTSSCTTSGAFRLDPVCTIANAQVIVQGLLFNKQITATVANQLQSILTQVAASADNSNLRCYFLRCALCLIEGYEIRTSSAFLAGQLGAVLRCLIGDCAPR